MPFRRVGIDGSPDVPPQRLARRLAALLPPGGTAHLRPQPAPLALATGGYGDTVDALERYDDWAEALATELSARGITLHTDPTTELDLLLLPRGAAISQVARVLADGVPVALLDTDGPFDRAALLVGSSPQHARPAASLLAHALRPVALHVLHPHDASPIAPDTLAAVLGLPTTPTYHSVDLSPLQLGAQVRQLLHEHDIHLVVLTAPGTLALHPLLALLRTLDVDILLVPGEEHPLLPIARRVELFAALERGGHVHSVAVEVDLAGRAWSPPDARWAAVEGGHPIGEVTTREGLVRAPVPEQDVLGLAEDPQRPVATLVATTRVLRPGAAPIALVGAGVDPEQVEAHRAAGRQVWALAIADASPRQLSQQLGVDEVLHIETVLQLGRPTDIPDAAHPVLLTRAAHALRVAGFSIEVPHLRLPPDEDPAPAGLAAALRERCGAQTSHVTSVQWLTNNADARRHVLSLIEEAQERLHLQTYMFDDDALGRQVAEALVRAAQRGVTVRLLVDSLWSQHGSLQMHNPLLTQLAEVPGVELQLYRPVGALQDLRVRNHRKLIVADGRRAGVHGRNLSRHYFVGFAEAALTPDTPEEEVPWLDVSVGLEGPVVQLVDESFQQTWQEAGGTAFPPVPIEGSGPAVWWVTHTALRDAHTLDAYRLLLEQAEEQVTLINTFLLSHELRHVLLGLLERGVRVRFLTGHVRPRYQRGSHAFPGARSRDMMTALVHGRLDALAMAGADVRAFAVPPQPAWRDDVGSILPHVHAKVVCVDGTLCATGSANLDISSSYWESEAMVIFPQASQWAPLRRWIEACFAASVRFDPDDPRWLQQSAQRGWWSDHWPGLLS